MLFGGIQGLIPAKYHILYITSFEVLMLFICYKEVKTNKLSEKIIVCFGIMLMTLPLLMLNADFMLKDSPSARRGNDYVIKCIKIGEIYNKRYGGNTVSLKMSEPYLLSISHDINQEEKKMIENSSCTCVELKLYKSSTGIYYIKNRDGGIVKECEE